VVWQAFLGGRGDPIAKKSTTAFFKFIPDFSVADDGGLTAGAKGHFMFSTGVSKGDSEPHLGSLF
jgi:hypothetical protein